MRLNKTLQACVAFATFANEHKMRPADLAELINLASARKAAEEMTSSAVTQVWRTREEGLRRIFEDKAQAAGFTVEWNGLFPTLIKDGRQYYLPPVD